MNDDNFHGLSIKILSRRTTQTSDLGNLLELALTKESTEEEPTKERTNERKTPRPTGVRLIYKLSTNFETVRNSAKSFIRKRCAKDLEIQCNWNEVNRTRNKKLLTKESRGSRARDARARLKLLITP